MTFTQDELIKAIREAGVDEGDTPRSITTGEVVDRLGVSRFKAQALMRSAVRAGAIKPAMVWRTLELTGFRKRVQGYVLVEE